jgi:O-antigen/teichoic acid export membrane protein
VALYGASSGGRYALADRACSMPLALVASAVGQVYLAEAARNAHARPNELRGLFLGTTRSLARTAIGPAVLLAVLAPFLAGPVFGESWAETGMLVAILAPMYFMAFVAAATGDTLYVLERLDLQLLREVLRLALLGGSIPLAYAAGLPVAGAVVVLSVVGCVTYLAYGLVSWLAIVEAPGRARRLLAAEAEVDVAAARAAGDGPATLP